MNIIEAQNAVFAAVKAHFIACGLNETFAGPFRDLAPDPDSAEFPYVVMNFDPDGRVETTSEGVICELIFHLKVFDRDLGMVDAHRTTLSAEDAFHDDNPPTLDAGALMLFRVQNGGSMEENTKRIAQGWIEGRIMYWVPRT